MYFFKEKKKCCRVIHKLKCIENPYFPPTKKNNQYIQIGMELGKFLVSVFIFCGERENGRRFDINTIHTKIKDLKSLKISFDLIF